MASRRHVQYTPLALDDMDEDHGMLKEEDLRFAYNPRVLDRVPWKSIALALFLLALGSALIILSLFIFTGRMEGERSQAYGLLTLGILAFLPEAINLVLECTVNLPTFDCHINQSAGSTTPPLSESQAGRKRAITLAGGPPWSNLIPFHADFTGALDLESRSGGGGGEMKSSLTRFRGFGFHKDEQKQKREKGLVAHRDELLKASQVPLTTFSMFLRFNSLFLGFSVDLVSVYRFWIKK
ncbi:hypothetical protein BHE74_00004355 [Ensete ventricosum]|nr:hypothetical protein BHE74_00004355 [Ensete ventricosum]